MGTNLAVIRSEIEPRRRDFRDVLEPYKIPVSTFEAGMLAAFEQNSVLNYCDAQSVVNAIMTVAVQGLHLGPQVGHACVIPFDGKAVAITMVGGYTVIAARGSYTLQSRLVREGDKVKEYGGSEPRIEHEPVLGGKGKIIGVYAVARSNQLPVLFSPFLTLADVEAVRDKSKGYSVAKSKNRSHPWITDFNAMMLKTPKRLLAKDIPNDMLGAAAWLDTQNDLGNVAYLKPGGQGFIDTVASPYPDRQPEPGAPLDTRGPRWVWITPTGQELEMENADRWVARILRQIDLETDMAKLGAARERNLPVFKSLSEGGFGKAVETVDSAMRRKLMIVDAEVVSEPAGEPETTQKRTESESVSPPADPVITPEKPAVEPPPPQQQQPAATAGVDDFWSRASFAVAPIPVRGTKNQMDWDTWADDISGRIREAQASGDVERLRKLVGDNQASEARCTLARPDLKVREAFAAALTAMGSPR